MQDSPEKRDEAGKLFSGGAVAPGSGEATGEGGRGWSISILIVRGSPEIANQALDRVRRVAGFSEAYVAREGDVYTVAYGNYASPAEPKAQADLKRLREYEFEGGKPFRDAMMTPPPERQIAGSLPQYNLLSVRQDPLSKAKYTLQIGVYGRVDNQPPTAQDLAEIRRAAEQAVVKLRKEGDEAYYYHGPTKSMVTIGAFDESDYDEKRPGVMDGPRLRQAREKFPHNLVNGAEYRQKAAGATKARPQKSQIVQIPAGK